MDEKKTYAPILTELFYRFYIPGRALLSKVSGHVMAGQSKHDTTTSTTATRQEVDSKIRYGLGFRAML